MNARDVEALAERRDHLALPRQSWDGLPPPHHDAVVGLVVDTYRLMAVPRFADPLCPNGYWCREDCEDAGPCRWCGRGPEEHRHG